MRSKKKLRLDARRKWVSKNGILRLMKPYKKKEMFKKGKKKKKKMKTSSFFHFENNRSFPKKKTNFKEKNKRKQRGKVPFVWGIGG